MPDQVIPTVALTQASHLETVDQLSLDLQKVLAGCDGANLKSEVRDDVERLTAWIATYRDGLEAAHMISETAATTLSEARRELDLALQQILTLEDEGGNVGTPKQQRETEAMSKALRRLSGLIPAVATVISDPATPQPDMVPPAQEPPVQQPDVPNEVPEPATEPSEPAPTAPTIPPVTNPNM